jgi:putative methionine-R-sulfoxide reductase with GAF domain
VILPVSVSDLLGGEGHLRLASLLQALRHRWPEDIGVRVEVLYYNEEQNYLEQIEHLGFDSTRTEMQLRQLSSGLLEAGEGICAYAATMKQSVLVDEVARDPRYSSVQEYERDKTQSELAVPLLIGGRVLGVLNIEADVARAFSDRDLSYCEEVAGLLAFLIDYEAFMFEDAFLCEAEKAIASLSSIDGVLSELLDRVLSLMGSDCRGCVLVPAADSVSVEMLRVAANKGLDLKVNEERSLSSFGVIREALASPRGENYWRRSLNGIGSYVELAPDTMSEFAVVLRSEDRVIAVINVESSRPSISERYRRGLRKMVEHAAVILDSLRRKGEIEHREGAEMILRAAGIEAHSLKNLAGGLIPALIELGPQLPPSKMKLAQGLLRRTGHLETTLRGLFRIGSVPFSAVVALAEKQAEELGVNLECQGRFGFSVHGSKNGLAYIFENLLLNTWKHGKSLARLQATIAVEIAGTDGVLRYWDNVPVPGLNDANLALFMSQGKGQGLGIITALCKRYDWSVMPLRRGEGLEFKFTFNCLL